MAGDLEVPRAVSRFPRLSLTPLLLTAAAIVIGYLAFTTARYVVHDYRLRNDEAALRREIGALDADHARLVAVRDYLESDEYVEYVARRILGLVRPGETLVVVSGVQATPAAAVDATPAGPGDRGAWWEELFFPTAAPTPAP